MELASIAGVKISNLLTENISSSKGSFEKKNGDGMAYILWRIASSFTLYQ